MENILIDDQLLASYMEIINIPYLILMLFIIIF